jgi:hypothetical protein
LQFLFVQKQSLSNIIAIFIEGVRKRKALKRQKATGMPKLITDKKGCKQKLQMKA